MHHIRTVTWAGALATALLLTAGCASATAPVAAPPSAAPTSCRPPSTAPGSTEDSDGFVHKPLPDDVRCLAAVAGGEYLVLGTDGAASALPETERRVLGGGQLVVEAADRESPMAALALCNTLLGMGYGPGGAKQVPALAVHAGAAVLYSASLDHRACTKVL